MRQVILRADHEDGGWIADVPSLPGCLSQGETKAEALANVRDAITAWISAALTTSREVPRDPRDAEIVDVAEEI
jgi:antitoxin HicB